MEPERLVTFRLPPDTLSALTDAARLRQCSPADLIRRAISTSLRPQRAAPCQDDLRDVVAMSMSWHDLQRRLRARGAVLRLRADGEIWLHAWPSDQPLGPSGDWGLDRHDLTLRYAHPFPGAVGGSALPAAAVTAQDHAPALTPPQMRRPSPPGAPRA
jgi:hypothetical protein